MTDDDWDKRRNSPGKRMMLMDPAMGRDSRRRWWAAMVTVTACADGGKRSVR